MVKKFIIFLIKRIICDEHNQYIWGKIIRTIIIENQFILIFILIITIEGSNEENKFDIKFLK